MTSSTVNPDPTSAPKATESLIYPIRSAIQSVELAKLFPNALPIEIELGSGDGSFLVEYARRHPEHGFIGIERLLGRLKKLDRKGRRAGLTNLRGIRIESVYLLQYLLPRHSVTALHVYFPDPWPKRKHRANRLVNERFPTMAREVLVPGGTVYLRTDDRDYFDQMTFVFSEVDFFMPTPTPADLAELLTDFERDFIVRGVPTNRAAYRLRAG